jgi:hypothetical protein
MTDTSLPQIPGLDDSTGLDTRLPSPDLGAQDVRIDLIRFHRSSFGNLDGVMVEVTDHDGNGRAWRINLGGKFPKFGATDCKRLAAAIRGLAFDDPRAAALSPAEVASMYGPTNPFKGAKIRIEAFESDKANPKTGRRYVNARVLGPATGAPAVTHAPTAAPAPAFQAPAAPPPPPAAPPAPAAVQGPPAGWYAFPVGDPRHGTHYYDASGAIRPV